MIKLPPKSNLRSLPKLLSQHWPLFSSLFILWIAIVVILLQSLSRTQGHIGYALDDAYIHMAIAKNLAQHGIWGVTPYEYSSASSSILWTLLLSSIYYLIGNYDFIPLILNIVFASFVIFLVYFLLKNLGKQHKIYIFFLLLLTILITPLLPMIFSGMEQNLHIVLTLLFTGLSAQYIANSKKASPMLKVLYGITPLFASIRYESLFIITPVIFLLLVRKKFTTAAWIAILSFAPLCIFGIYSISQGGYFLPTSVVAKTFSSSENQELHSILFKESVLRAKKSISFLTQHPHIWNTLFILCFTFLVLSPKQKSKNKDYHQILLIIAIMAIFIHVNFIHLDFFFRYEAYLIVLSLVAASNIIFTSIIPIKLVLTRIKTNFMIYFPCLLIVLFCLTSSPFTIRGLYGTKVTSQATKNIYEQQYQMGLFVKQFYQSQAIAANDIGAISYLGNIQLLDLWGLANREVADLTINRRYSQETIQKLAQEKNVKIAILYETIFSNIIPNEWTKVGEWRIKSNVVAASDTVSFYAIEKKEATDLIQNLNLFSPQLPPDVEESGEYVKYSKK